MPWPDGAFLQSAAAAGLALLLLQGVPRFLRSLYNWTAGMLFSSLSGRLQAIAMVLCAASLLWVLVVAQAFYTPLAVLTPRILPFPDGLIRWIIFIEIWVLLIAMPLIMGGVQAWMAKGSLLYRLSMFPRSFVHVIGITLALLTLVPWIIWRFIVVRARRKKEDQVRLEIDTDRYESVADWLMARLRDAGLSPTAMQLPEPVLLSRWFLQRLGPPILRPKSAYVAKRIVGEGYSVMVFDGLIDSVSDPALRARVRMAVLGNPPPEGLWLTRSEEGRRVEEAIRSGGDTFDQVPRLFTEVDLPLEEWRILSWEYLQVLIELERKNAEVDPLQQATKDAIPLLSLGVQYCSGALVGATRRIDWGFCVC